jgi:hypothetical protein
MPEPFGRFTFARLGCRLVNSRLPDALLGSGATDRLFDRHLRTCLACQAEAAQQAPLARAVHDLPQAGGTRAPWGLVDEVMDGIARRERAARIRGKALTAASLGVLSAFLTAVVWVATRRRGAKQPVGSR